MTLESDQVMRIVEDPNQKSSDILYMVSLSGKTMEFLGVNIRHRNDYFGDYTSEERELFKTLWSRIEAHNRANGVYSKGKIDFSFSDISFLGRVLKEVVESETVISENGFCKNACRAFLELNAHFVMVGGIDNTDLRESFERVRERI